MQRAEDRSAWAVWGVVAVVVAHAVGVVTSLDVPERLQRVHEVAGWVGALIGVVGTFAAVSAFSRGDYLRKVWAAFAGSATLLLVGTAMLTYWRVTAPGRSFLESPLLPIRMGVIVTANVLSTWALVLTVGTFRRSGLRPPSTWRTYVALGLGACVALAVAGPQMVADTRRMTVSTADAFSALTSLASTVGDFATLLLIVPVLRLAYMLRGGRLARVWWVMGLSGAAWLVYDARAVLSEVLPGGEANSALELLRVLRSPGLALVGLSGWLQRTALEARTQPPAQSQADVREAA